MLYGNQEGSKVFSIPVEWTVTDTIDIRADSLREAVEFLTENADSIPLGEDPQYIDGTWRISADESGLGDIEDIIEVLDDGYGYSERDAEDYDEVEYE